METGVGVGGGDERRHRVGWGCLVLVEALNECGVTWSCPREEGQVVLKGVGADVGAGGVADAVGEASGLQETAYTNHHVAYKDPAGITPRKRAKNSSIDKF